MFLCWTLVKSENWRNHIHCLFTQKGTCTTAAMSDYVTKKLILRLCYRTSIKTIWMVTAFIFLIYFMYSPHQWISSMSLQCDSCRNIQSDQLMLPVWHCDVTLDTQNVLSFVTYSVDHGLNKVPPKNYLTL